MFISHSAKEPEARALCKAIAGYLASKFEVLWDDKLQTAQVWRAAIDEWIWACDAAVLVLSKAATESRYVAYEAAHLRQRWIHMKPRFTLVPMWCPDVNEQILMQSMGALQLQEIHTNIKLPSWPPNATVDPAAFDDTVRQVATTLETVREQARPRHEIEDLLIKELNLGTANEDALTNIADAYHVPSLPAGAKQDRANLLARLLLDPVDKLGDLRFQRLKSGIPTMMTAVESAKDCLAQKVCNNPAAGATAVAKRIQKLASYGEPVFLILRADAIDASVVTAVCNAWKELCVFLYTEQMDEQQLAAQFPGIQLIDPPLSADDEGDARAGWTYQQLENLEEFDS